MRLFLGTLVCFALSWGVSAKAETFSLGVLNRDLVQRFGSDLSRFSLLSGTTTLSLKSSGVAGLLDETNPHQLILAWGQGRICELDVSQEDVVGLDANALAEIGPVIREITPSARCKGMLVRDAAGSAHLFLLTNPTIEGRAGAWVSPDGIIQALHMPERLPTITSVRTIIDFAIRPTLIISLGQDRGAYVNADGDVRMFLYSRDNEVVRDVGVCDTATSHPLYVASAFMRHGSSADLAYQAVNSHTTVDLVAYISCP